MQNTHFGSKNKIDSHQVPTSYFVHFLDKHQVQVNSNREINHSAQPVYSSRTKRVSYKIFDPERQYLSPQKQDLVGLKTGTLFAGNTSIHNTGSSRFALNAEQEISRAKQLDSRHGVQKPPFKSVLLVGPGVGRSTREVEIIWWPELYSTRHGQLTIRMYIEKGEF